MILGEAMVDVHDEAEEVLSSGAEDVLALGPVPITLFFNALE